MIKRREIECPESCLNRAANDEMLFVLLGRDRCAPWVVRFWVVLRILSGKNRWSDPQVREALVCARQMRDVRK